MGNNKWAKNSNLLSIAIKFSPTGEVVEVKLDEFGTFVRILVYDKGPRISDKFKPHIFNRFSQANITTSSTGTELKRSISNMIYKAHQGRIHLDTKMDLGITFYLELTIKQTIVP